MKKLLLLFIVVLVPSLFFAGCGDDLTTTSQDVAFKLDSFQLTYTAPSAPASAEKVVAAKAAASTAGNPSCGSINIAELIADYSEFGRIKEVKINEVRYTVSDNTTAGTITGKLSLTDPDSVTNELMTVAKVEIDGDVNESILPFVENGKDTVNYYLSNRSKQFQYCAEADNVESLSLTLEIELDLEVVLKIL